MDSPQLSNWVRERILSDFSQMPRKEVTRLWDILQNASLSWLLDISYHGISDAGLRELIELCTSNIREASEESAVQDAELERLRQMLAGLQSLAQEKFTERWRRYGEPNCESKKRPERCLTSISFWIPRKQREGIVGDILEDCHELRNLGKGSFRIWTHVIWQFLIAVVTSIPASVLSAIKGKLTPKD